MNKEKIIEIFKELSKIPRTSKNEQEAAKWVIGYAKERGYKTEQDTAGNVVVYVPASKGFENKEGYVVQSHLDMVGQKTSTSTHDFTKDPIEFFEDNGWLRAKNGTTLGADNGIGVSIALSLLESDISHPELELLFTVDEETGLTGAQMLSEKLLSKKKLLNLDGELHNTITIGCAGSLDTIITKDYTEEIADDLSKQYLSISITGGNGGHSGIDIHKKIASTNVLLSRLLAILSNNTPINLVSIKGGTVRNAISRDTVAVIAVSKEDGTVINDTSESFIRDVISGEYGKYEKKLKLEIKEVEADRMLSEDSSQEIISFMNSIPHGVHSMSSEVEGLVESSNNFAMINLKDGNFTLTTMTRSSVKSKLNEITTTLISLAHLIDAEVKNENTSPSWQPNVDAELLKEVAEAYKKVNNKETIIEACHAGLECGAIGDKYPGMEMVSIGPEILGAHSPDERLNLKDLETFLQILETVLSN